jgi:hypothetical protein
MKVSQQIVGVNQRLGNRAVPNMQGTTRLIYDSFQFPAVVASGTATFFQNVQAKIYPLTNVSQNRFEVGESLAIQGFSLAVKDTSLDDIVNPWTIVNAASNINTAILNFYIGNQRIIKDLDLMYGFASVGKTFSQNNAPITPKFYLETPIIIPPQIEFYATVNIYTDAVEFDQTYFVLSAFGTGTLLNTKENF